MRSSRIYRGSLIAAIGLSAIALLLYANGNRRVMLKELERERVMYMVGNAAVEHFETFGAWPASIQCLFDRGILKYSADQSHLYGAGFNPSNAKWLSGVNLCDQAVFDEVVAALDGLDATPRNTVVTHTAGPTPNGATVNHILVERIRAVRAARERGGPRP